MSNDERGTGRVRRPNHWIYLDRWWAQRLGVTRTAGVYRIRSRELARRLSEENWEWTPLKQYLCMGRGRQRPVSTTKSGSSRNAKQPRHRAVEGLEGQAAARVASLHDILRVVSICQIITFPPKPQPSAVEIHGHHCPGAGRIRCASVPKDEEARELIQTDLASAKSLACMDAVRVVTYRGGGIRPALLRCLIEVAMESFAGLH